MNTPKSFAMQIAPDQNLSNEKKYPLTPQQYGLWVEWRLHPDNTSYNTCVKLRLDGELDQDRFSRALDYVVQFFDSLRVYYREENGVPHQFVKPEGRYTLDFEDISTGASVETEGQRQKAEEFLARKLATPVDLTEFPICRAALIKTTSTCHYFIGMVPHIISDGASAVLFLESVSVAYNKGWEGLVEAYGETQKNWDDYFAEMKDKTEDEKKEQVDFWSERLSGAQHTVDFSNNPIEDSESVKSGKRVYFDFDAELSDRIKKHARQNRTTPFNVLVCIFSILMNRYYRQDDVLIGYPVNIRPAGYRHHFGFFVNILPLRVDMTGNPTYTELLERVSKTRKEDRKHQDFPAFDVVKTIRNTVSDFDGRVFNISMAQTVSRLVNLNLEGIESTPLESDYNDVNDDLSLSYEMMQDGRIGLWLEYRLNMFSRSFIDQMMAHLDIIAREVLDRSDVKISDINIVKPDFENELIHKFSCLEKTEQGLSANNIFDAIKLQASKTPDAIALKGADGETVTYAEMINRAEVLASHLINRGAKKQKPVLVCMPRGVHQIVSVLAVMAAGGCYVPLTDDAPKSNLEYILEDTGADFILSVSCLNEKFESLSADIIYVDETDQNSAVDLPDVGLGDLSYIIYTSGSTGRPKGVLLKHGQVLPRLEWLKETFALTADDRVLQNTSYSFDVSVAEIYWPLMCGAQLVLTDAEKFKDAHYLLGVIEREKITTSCMVPSLLNALISLADKTKFVSLQLILSAGEALSPEVAKEFKKISKAKLINIYGPTEAAIYATWFDTNALDEGYKENYIPIGRPLSETEIYILDEYMRPVPPMVAGDLYIGGKGVATGYLNRDDLTEKVFVNNPFSDETSARLYKTGDLACFERDGNVRFLGRADNQVKVRGYRVELEGIESVMMQVDGVQDCAVKAYGASAQGQRLVAYYVADHDFDETILKKAICAALPQYMMPSFFVSLDEIPRTASGKTNRRSLPDPEALLKRSQNFVAPATAVEIKIANIWAQILKIPVNKIGVHDSFFNMGGDSLMAIQFVSAAENEGLNFRTEALFETRTIFELAQSLDVSDAENAQNVQYDLDTENALPMLPRQHKYFQDGMSNPHYWNRVFYFDASHHVKFDHLTHALKRILDLHVGLRSYFKGEGSHWSLYCADHDQYAIEDIVLEFDFSDEAPDARDEMIAKTLNDIQETMRLDEPLLMRVALFRFGPKQGRLAIICHHLLVDIISSRIVFEDFIRAYESKRRKLPVKIKTPKTNIFEWSEYLNGSYLDKDFSSEIEYWKTVSAKDVKSLKTDFEVSKDTQVEGYATLYQHAFDVALTDDLLKRLPKESGASIQDCLLAAFTDVICAYNDDDHIRVSITGHGRHAQNSGYDLSRTVGWLNTVYPVLIARPDSGSAVQNIKEQLSRVPSDNMAYNVLRHVKKDLSVSANTDLFFNYVSQIDAILPDNLPFTPMVEPKGTKASDDRNALKYALYVEAGVFEKKLVLRATYSDRVFKTETIEKICNQMEGRIESYVRSLN